jgi:hypothetical protein
MKRVAFLVYTNRKWLSLAPSDGQCLLFQAAIERKQITFQMWLAHDGASWEVDDRVFPMVNRKKERQ